MFNVKAEGFQLLICALLIPEISGFLPLLGGGGGFITRDDRCGRLSAQLLRFSDVS